MNKDCKINIICMAQKTFYILIHTNGIFFLYIYIYGNYGRLECPPFSSNFLNILNIFDFAIPIYYQ